MNKKNEKREIEEHLNIDIGQDDIQNIKFSSNGMCTFVMDILVDPQKRNSLHKLSNYDTPIEDFEYFQMELDTDWDSSYISVSIKGHRLETDKEYNDRLEAEIRQKEANIIRSEDMKKNAAKAAKKKEEDEKKLYLELKKKYEGKQLK
jgi:hypothetical protein